MQCIEDNKVDSALDYLGKLPDDFGRDGKTVGALKGQLNAAKPIMDLAGTYKSCDPSKCRVTQTSKSTGYYYWWESTDTITGEDLSIDASLNSDGSVHLSGSVSFYRYTNFSTIGEYVNGSSVSKSFSLDVTGIPGSVPMTKRRLCEMETEHGRWAGASRIIATICISITSTRLILGIQSRRFAKSKKEALRVDAKGLFACELFAWARC